MTSDNGFPATATPPVSASASFDPIARPYRWMEYLTFGAMLWRCRTHFLPQLTGRRSALVLGDGDGRFTAALLAANPQLHADAVDSSSAMLRLLAQRARAVTSDASARLCVHHSDALAFARNMPADTRYDLVVTHFFLDCLTQSEVESLVRAIAPHLHPEAHWLVSDFRVPDGAMRRPARALIRAFYLAFHILTGLRVTRLPDHISAFCAAGFAQTAQRLSLAGTLTTELWTRTPSN